MAQIKCKYRCYICDISDYGGRCKCNGLENWDCTKGDWKYIDKDGIHISDMCYHAIPTWKMSENTHKVFDLDKDGLSLKRKFIDAGDIYTLWIDGEEIINETEERERENKILMEQREMFRKATGRL